MREQIHHETVPPAEWLFCSDGLLPCFRDNETGIRNGPAFFQQARRAPLHGSPMQPACQTAGSPTGRPPRHSQRRSPTSQPPAASGAAPASRQPLTIGGAAPVRPDKRRTARQRDANPLHSNPRRPVTKWRANRHGSHPPEPPPLCALLHKPAGPSPPPSYRIPPPELPRPAVLSHNSPEPPRPAILSHNSPGPPRSRRPPPPGKARTRPRHPPPSGKSAYQFPRLAPLRMHDRYIRSAAGPPGARRPPPPGKARTSSPGSRALPLGETRTTPPARAAEHARPLHPFRGGATRRAPLRRGRRGRAAENIFFLIPEYPLTTA